MESMMRMSSREEDRSDRQEDGVELAGIIRLAIHKSVDLEGKHRKK